MYNLKSNWKWPAQFQSFTNDKVSTVTLLLSVNVIDKSLLFTRKPAGVVHGWYLGHHHNSCEECNLSSHTPYTTPLSHLSHVVLFQVEQVSLPGGFPTALAVPKLEDLDQKNPPHRCTNSQNSSSASRELYCWLATCHSLCSSFRQMTNDSDLQPAVNVFTKYFWGWCIQWGYKCFISIRLIIPQRSYTANTTPMSCRHHNRGVNLLVLKQTVLGVAIWAHAAFEQAALSRGWL